MVVFIIIIRQRLAMLPSPPKQAMRRETYVLPVGICQEAEKMAITPE